uniref:Uncharacterized protein n=1 Tax=Amblyomma maculatum TaxID=34609 RepID=G3MT78_AMBMU
MMKASIWSLLVLAVVCVVIQPVSSGPCASQLEVPKGCRERDALSRFVLLQALREKLLNLWNSSWSPKNWLPFWPKPRCKRKNEVYRRCNSGRCAEEMCFLRTVYNRCPKNCGYGCYCKRGYCRNLLFECVRLTGKYRPPILPDRQ